MKRPFIGYTLVLSCALLSLSFIHSTRGSSILDQEDHVLVESQERPHLSGPGFESYEEWTCLPTGDLTLNCLSYGDETVVSEAPTISIVHQLHFFEFAGTHYPLDGSCDQELTRWRQVIENQDELCVLAAYLQEMPVSEAAPWDSHSYWVVDRIKSRSGTWVVRPW